ncbi:YciI family protein [Telmatobacter bradus]|uniref:YciI family protein n=1 Tax=Telmatobacter bradus TaxID=474953 RepID=UPI003B438949
MYIVLLNYTQPLEVIEKHLAAHRLFLDQHYVNGNLLASGPRNPRTGGVLLARGIKREEVEALIAEDPFAKANVATYEIIEFEAVKLAPGTENLFRG